MKPIRLKDATPGTIVVDCEHDPIKFEVVSMDENIVHLKYIDGNNIYTQNDNDLYPFILDAEFYLPED